jgi:hypothetical protein
MPHARALAEDYLLEEVAPARRTHRISIEPRMPLELGGPIIEDVLRRNMQERLRAPADLLGLANWMTGHDLEAWSLILEVCTYKLLTDE